MMAVESERYEIDILVEIEIFSYLVTYNLGEIFDELINLVTYNLGKIFDELINLFLSVKWPRIEDLHTPEKCGLQATRNFYITTDEGITLGVW
jgi:hypothetical protein